MDLISLDLDALVPPAGPTHNSREYGGVEVLDGRGQVTEGAVPDDHGHVLALIGHMTGHDAANRLPVYEHLAWAMPLDMRDGGAGGARGAGGAGGAGGRCRRRLSRVGDGGNEVGHVGAVGRNVPRMRGTMRAAIPARGVEGR